MRVLYVFIIILLGAVPANAGGADALRAGNKAYYKEKYGEAFDLYEQAAKQGATQAAAFNKAAALYKLKDYEGALQIYTNLAEEGGMFTQRSFFNAGNAAYMRGDKEAAAAYFKKAILLDNKDEAAIHNLQFVLQQKDDNNKKEPQQKPGENKDRDNNDEQNNQSNQNNQPQQNLTQDEADNILQMVKENQNTARPLPQSEGSGAPKVEKDW